MHSRHEDCGIVKENASIHEKNEVVPRYGATYRI